MVVSVLIPVFNEPVSLLKACVLSIQTQTYDNFEVLLLVEALSGEANDFIERLTKSDCRFHKISIPLGTGLAGSLNVGLNKARGRFVARMDVDDVSLCRRFEMQVAFLNRHPNIDVVGSSVLDLVTGRLIQFPTSHESICAKLKFVNPICHPSVMFRRDVVLAVGAYDQSFRAAEDLELWLRCASFDVEFANLSTPLLEYRMPESPRSWLNWKENIRARRKHAHLFGCISVFLVTNLLLVYGFICAGRRMIRG